MARLGDVFEAQITGEWGNECVENEAGTKVLRTTNFTSDGMINFDNVVLRRITQSKVEKKIEKSVSTDEKKKGLKILSFRADYVSVLIRFGIFLIFAFILFSVPEVIAWEITAGISAFFIPRCSRPQTQSLAVLCALTYGLYQTHLWSRALRLR